MALLLLGSKAIADGNRIYHKDGCLYAKRIKYENIKKISMANALTENACFCRYCSGLKGDVLIEMQSFEQNNRRKGMNLHYEEKTDTLYVSTNIGFWKIFFREELECYVLHHRNFYNTEMSMETAMYGKFHKQGDVRPTDSLKTLLDYIYAHDASKPIITDDYRKLPQDTRKQKKYYKRAEKKEKRKQEARLDKLFATLEKSNSGLRELSFC